MYIHGDFRGMHVHKHIYMVAPSLQLLTACMTSSGLIPSSCLRISIAFNRLFNVDKLKLGVIFCTDYLIFLSKYAHKYVTCNHKAQCTHSWVTHGDKMLEVQDKITKKDS